MTIYSLTIYIDNTLLGQLKTEGYSLCVSKKVAGGEYKIIWKAKDVYLYEDGFQWTDEYQVFGQLPPAGLRVKANTKPVDIAGGETAVLNTSGIMDEATGSPSGTTFTVDNEFQPILLGVNCKIDGVFLPIYLGLQPTAAPGTEAFTPKELIYVCFEREVETSSIIAKALVSGIEVDFTNTTSNTISYIPDSKKGKWVHGKLA